MPAQRKRLFTPTQLVSAMRKKLREMEWTIAALADYLEVSERQCYRYFKKESYPKSSYFRKLFFERLDFPAAKK